MVPEIDQQTASKYEPCDTIVLDYINRNDGALRWSEAVEELGISREQIEESVRRLMEQNLLKVNETSSAKVGDASQNIPKTKTFDFSHRLSIPDQSTARESTDVRIVVANSYISSRRCPQGGRWKNTRARAGRRGGNQVHMLQMQRGQTPLLEKTAHYDFADDFCLPFQKRCTRSDR